MIDLFFRVIEKLESKNIPYMVVGSVASMVYGEPRMTHDMDMVLDIPPEKSFQLSSLFPPEEFYCPPIEILKSEIIHRGQFNLIHQNTGIKIDIIIRKNTEHGKTEFQRRKKVLLWKDKQAFLATPEDIIIKKFSFYKEGGSERHLRDIRGILAESEVDKKYLNGWLKKLGLFSLWEKL